MIVLLTDFGVSDPYVALMKVMIRRLNPLIEILDLTHGITPFSIDHGACVLEDSMNWFPEGTVFVVVVDPTVGSDRMAILICYQNRYFIGPDNGVLSAAILDSAHCFVIPVPQDASKTFHGRDVFAPFAAKLTLDFSILDQLQKLPVNQLKRITDSTSLKVLYADHFGNLVTNIKRETISEKQWRILYRGLPLRLVNCYSELNPKELGAYFGSSGRLEFAVRNGRADKIKETELALLT